MYEYEYHTYAMEYIVYMEWTGASIALARV